MYRRTPFGVRHIGTCSVSPNPVRRASHRNLQRTPNGVRRNKGQHKKSPSATFRGEANPKNQLLKTIFLINPPTPNSKLKTQNSKLFYCWYRFVFSSGTRGFLRMKLYAAVSSCEPELYCWNGPNDTS